MCNPKTAERNVIQFSSNDTVVAVLEAPIFILLIAIKGAESAQPIWTTVKARRLSKIFLILHKE
jgi:hypothetical protein